MHGFHQSGGEVRISGGLAGGFHHSLDNVHCVIAVGSELVGDGLVKLVILGDKSLGGVILGVSSEGSQHHQAFNHGQIRHLGLDAVQAVAAEVNHVVQLALGLGQEHGSLSSVDGQEHHIAAGVADGVDLGGEVRGGAGSEGLLGDDLQALNVSLSLEGLIQTGGVVDIGLIEHGNLGAQVVVHDVVSGSGALCGVVEADTEGVLIALDAGLGRGGGRHDQDVVSLGSGDDGSGFAGEHAAQGHVHAVIHEFVVSRNSGVGIALGVLGGQGEGPAVDAAGSVDLIHSNLSAVADRSTIVGIVAGHGADEAQQDVVVAIAGGGGFVGCSLLLGAAGCQTHNHENGQQQSNDLLHFLLPRFLVGNLLKPFGNNTGIKNRLCRRAKPLTYTPATFAARLSLRICRPQANNSYQAGYLPQQSYEQKRHCPQGSVQNKRTGRGSRCGHLSSLTSRCAPRIGRHIHLGHLCYKHRGRSFPSFAYLFR